MCPFPNHYVFKNLILRDSKINMPIKKGILKKYTVSSSSHCKPNLNCAHR